MAAIDLLLEWSPTSERMHQVVLAGLLHHTALLRKLGINGTPTNVETETHRGLFDLTVSFSDAQTLNVELKIDASLDFKQMKRQMAHVAKGKERLLYMLLGSTQYRRPANEIENFRTVQDPRPSKEQVAFADLENTVRALRSLAAEAPDPDRRDLAAAYGYFLRKMHETHEAYAGTPLDEWSTVNWFAFFNEIRLKLRLAVSMDYVSNPNGGFAGCWWDFNGLGRHRPAPDRPSTDEAYLQLEESKLCFKVTVGDEEFRGDVRNRFSQVVIDTAARMKMPVCKPQRFGTGDSMTVAVFDGDYRCPNGGKKLDWDYVSSTLAKAGKVLRAAVEEYKRK